MMMRNDDVAGSGDQRGMLMEIFDLAITIIEEEEEKCSLHCFSIKFLDARTMRICIS